MPLYFRFRLYLFVFVLLAAFSIIIAQLWRIQILQQNYWLSKMYLRSEIKVRVPGVRGKIKDRNGIILATNVPSYEVSFNLEELLNEYKRRFNKIPIYKRSIGINTGQTKKEDDIALMVNKLIISKLNKLELSVFHNANQLRTHYRTHHGLVPFVYRRDIPFEEFAIYAEHSFEIPGMHINVKPLRKYVYGSLASHILGYMALFDDQKIPEDEYKKYEHYVGDDFGIDGIEKTKNDILSARPGQKIIEKDEKGNIVKEINYIKPKNGADIYLSIDARIQYITEKILSSIGQGAAVVIDPNNGEILSMASTPSYDPNQFIPSITQEEWDEIGKDKTKPMINRAILPYGPGSTFKIPTALAGCYKYDNFSTNYRQYCAGSTLIGNRYFECWIAKKSALKHGSLNMVEAIQRSCNCFFYQSSMQIEIDTMKKVFSLVGLGQLTDIPLPSEEDGIVPDTNWQSIHRPFTPWTKALTAMTAIGQGDAQATPLQMAMLAATIANGGYYYKPQLIHKIESNNYKKQTIKSAKAPIIDLSKHGISKASIQAIRLGMFKVVNEWGGTARSANLNDKKISVAGKTGTCQTGKVLKNGKNDTNAWFISFAPYEKPQIAVAVFVKHGNSGGSVAAPIAKAITERSINILNNKESIKITPLKPNKGHNDFIKSLSIDSQLLMANAIKILDSSGEEINTADSQSAITNPLIIKNIKKKKKQYKEIGRASCRERVCMFV